MNPCVNFSSDDSSYPMVVCKWTMALIGKELRFKKGTVRWLWMRIISNCMCFGEEEGEAQYVFYMRASVCPLSDPSQPVKMNN